MGAGDLAIHRARFARFHELRALLSRTPSTDGVLLGTIRYFHFFNRFVVVRPTPQRREIGNTLIVAPTRGGKGLLAVSELLTWKSSAVVNDIKGDLFHATAGYRSSLGDVFVIDPTGVGHCFDPLYGKQTEDEFFSTASYLLFEAEERERIFTQRATVMLTQMFLAARIATVSPFPYVRSLIRSGLTNVAARLDQLDPELATQFLDTNFEKANLTDRFLLSSWGTLTARLRPLLTETVIRSLTGSDFTPEHLLRGETPVTVYLRWKEQDLLALSPLIRLLWGSLISELITAYDTNQGRGCKPILLLLDEAGRTAIPALSEHATTVVGRGIYLWVAVQSLSQLEVVYGKPRSQVLRDNMETQLYYRPTDLTTAEHIERSLGRHSAYARSTTERQGVETSIGATEQGVPLLTAQEIRQLKDEDVIGFHRHLPPFRMKRVDWRQFSILRQRHNMQVPELPVLPQIADIPDFQEGRQTALQSSAYIDPDMLHPTGETIIIDFSRKVRNKDRRN